MDVPITQGCRFMWTQVIKKVELILLIDEHQLVITLYTVNVSIFEFTNFTQVKQTGHGLQSYFDTITAILFSYKKSHICTLDH